MGESKKITLCHQYRVLLDQRRPKLDEIGLGRDNVQLPQFVTLPPICSEAKPTGEEAAASLLSKLEAGRPSKPVKQSAKVCNVVPWAKFLRTVEDDESLFEKGREKICVESETLELAEKNWEKSATEFVKDNSYLKFRNPKWQVVADRRHLEILKDVPEIPRIRGRFM